MSEKCPSCKGDVLTCLACGVNGVGVGFEHECDHIAARREREACAQVCDRWAAANIDAFREQALAAECCARHIRERGKTSRK